LTGPALIDLFISCWLYDCAEFVENRTVSQDFANISGVKDWIARCTRARQLQANDVMEDAESHGTFKKCEVYQKYPTRLK
jgi:hypothetical protein